jgi:hypothetical protein
VTFPRLLGTGKFSGGQVSGALGTTLQVANPELAAGEDEGAVSGEDPVDRGANQAAIDEEQIVVDEQQDDGRSSTTVFLPTKARDDEEIRQRQEQRNARRRQHAVQKKLEKELDFVAHSRPEVGVVQSILKILFEKWGVKPTAVHYEAMILANCDAENGSVNTVKALLEEMEREGVVVGASVYYAVLKVRPPPALDLC